MKELVTQASLPTEEQIQARAYRLFVERGRRHGHDVDDWLQAEYELMQLPTEKIAELSPPRTKQGRITTKSLAGVVQTAVLLGANALPHLQR
jgi:hypothetical protein